MIGFQDWVGLTVAILTILVTVLIGWQVVNAIEMRTIIKEVDTLKQNLINLDNEYEYKNKSLQWLSSALHGSLFNREKFKDDTEYFLHCLDVVGCFIKSGTSVSNTPFLRSIEVLEATLDDIIKRNDASEIFFMGGNKDFVREWYQEISRIIDTEVQHLSDIKRRINQIYEDYIILTKDIKISKTKH